MQQSQEHSSQQARVVVIRDLSRILNMHFSIHLLLVYKFYSTIMVIHSQNVSYEYHNEI